MNEYDRGMDPLPDRHLIPCESAGHSGRALLTRIVADLSVDPRVLESIPEITGDVPLASRLATGALAWASVMAAVMAARPARAPLAIADPAAIAWAYRSDRVFRIDGQLQPAWAPSSGFWAARDGWLRTHANYPHHARALHRGLGLSDHAAPDDIRAIIASSTTQDAVDRIVLAGGLAVATAHENPAHDAALRAQPLIDISRIGAAPPSIRTARPDAAAPLEGIRVLDLTRVIAGPVCTRTLALLGADVLRIDPPGLAEIGWQHLDTGHGKRSARLDASSPRMAELLDDADVVVLGYRPAALERLGLSAAHLSARYPGLIVAQLSAWGAENPDRAGFDSLVQAETGIAMVESSDGETPGVLPAQALDHSAGYLLAAGICTAVTRRRDQGGAWLVRTSLRRVAAELLGMPRQASAAPISEIDPARYLQDFMVDGHTVTTARSALPGFSFSAPRPWGSDAPEWTASRTEQE